MIQDHYSTYQRKGNHELQIRALNTIVADLQTQIDNLSTSGGSGGGGSGEIGTMEINKTEILFTYHCTHL